MIGIPLQRKGTDIPSFVTKLHNSLHSTYTAVRAHIISSHKRNKERYDKERPFLPYSIGDLGYMFLLLNQAGQRTMAGTLHCDRQAQ